jgi:hypothetical protein
MGEAAIIGGRASWLSSHQRRDITSPHESSMGVAGMPLLPVFRPPCVANVLTRSQILARLLRARENAHDNARSLSKGGRPMVDERPQLAAQKSRRNCSSSCRSCPRCMTLNP